MSARTALDWQSQESGCHTEIADVIRQISSKPVDDLYELRRRIVFTNLVSNKHDHLKNLVFIYVGGARWRLSPAFDINPSPLRHRVVVVLYIPAKFAGLNGANSFRIDQ